MSSLDVLLKSMCPLGVSRKPLSEFVEIVRGNGLQKKDFTPDGVGCIHYGQIYTKFNVATKTVLSHVSEELASSLKIVNPGDIIMAITSENVEDICKCVVWEGNDPIVTGGHSAILRHSQNSRYLAYWFQTQDFRDQKKKIVHGTKVMEVSPKDLSNVLVPLPPLKVQDEIVCILDSFTELTARKKQYEYYRDRLLSFDNISDEEREARIEVGFFG